MIYNSFKDKKLSALGFGSMRLPVINGDDGNIDRETTKKMVEYAMKNGVNYYDTAWGYHNGLSETVMGECLENYPRDSFYLATKFPGYDLSNMPKAEEIFEQQLKKCRVDHFDFYLIHNVCEMNIEQYLDPKYGIYDYFTEQKKNGRITHLGFSAHGSVEVMERFLEVYGDAMEFCQIQINWLDYTFQNAVGKLELLKKHDLPVWAMEPVRGGKLASLDSEDTAALSALRPDEKTAAWAFRFLQSIPEITVTLSGMSNMEQLEENIGTYAEAKPLTDEEKAALKKIADKMTGQTSLPCTSCRYCVSHCPMELDIPMLIGLYNEHVLTGGGFLAPMALMAVDSDKQPSSCVGCRSCEEVCPQQIKISEAMSDFTKKLGS